MLLELGEQGGGNARGEPVAGFAEGEAQATVGHEEVADLGLGCALAFVLGEFGEYLLLSVVERSAVELFEEVGMAEVFAEQADVAADGAFVAVEGGGEFGDFGVVTVYSDASGINGFARGNRGHGVEEECKRIERRAVRVSKRRAALCPWPYE